MSEISQLQINDITYNIADATARDSVSQNQLNLIYPIGSVYFTIDLNFDPNVTFGGT